MTFQFSDSLGRIWGMERGDVPLRPFEPLGVGGKGLETPIWEVKPAGLVLQGC